MTHERGAQGPRYTVKVGAIRKLLTRLGPCAMGRDATFVLHVGVAGTPAAERRRHHNHCFLTTGTTVKGRMRGRYRVPGALAAERG